MSLVKVKDTVVREEIIRSGKAAGTVLHKQKVALIQGNYELPFDIGVAADKPYPVGDYMLSHDSYRLNQFGGLELDRYNIGLTPVKVPAAAQRAGA